MKTLIQSHLRKLFVAGALCLATSVPAQEASVPPTDEVVETSGAAVEEHESAGIVASAVITDGASPEIAATTKEISDGTVVESIEALDNEGIEVEATAEMAAPPTPPAPPEPRPDQTRRAFAEDVVRIFADAKVGPDEAAGDFVVVIGDGVIDGQVQGDAVVVLGNVSVNGKINGDLVNVMGKTTLGPNAVINGELVVAGGNLEAAQGAIIRGQTVEVSILPDFAEGHFEWLSAWIHKGLLMGRPLPHDQTWAWITAGVFLLVALLISLVFRRAIDVTVDVLDNRPAAALLTGMLVFILSGPLAFLLMVSVVGIFIIPFLFIGTKVAAIFGIIAVYRFSGQQFGLRSMPAFALLVGGAVFTLLYAVPVVGFLTLFLASILGTGATCLALVQGIRKESSGSKTGRAPMSPVSPTTKAAQAPEASGMTGPAVDLSEEPSAGMPETAAGLRDAQISTSSDDPLMAERVGFWPRLGATALDFLLVAGLIQFMNIDWALPILWIAYHLVFWSWRQTTIGGIVMNLKVVRLDGQSLSFGVVAVRSLASIFSGMVVGLGFFWASWDEERQSWHDKIAGTTIVRVPKGTSLL